METFGLNSTTSFRVLKIIITATISALSIAWWIWIVYSCLGQLKNSQISFIELLIETLRALATALAILAVIAFL